MLSDTFSLLDFQKSFGGKASIKQGSLQDVLWNTVLLDAQGKEFGVGYVWKRLYTILSPWSFQIYLESFNKLCNKETHLTGFSKLIETRIHFFCIILTNIPT